MKFPERQAIVNLEGESITYQELLNEARQLSNELGERGLGTGHRIGLLASKTMETVVALFGIALSGATYVPLDAEAPASRNLQIIKNCQLDALLLEASLAPLYAIVLNVPLQLDLKGIEAYLLRELATKELKADIVPAFILNTSGSTGIPKGVKITHKNALSFILWANRTFSFSDQDVFASIAPLHFDLSVFDLFVALLNGASLQLINAKVARNPRMLAALIDQRNISVWYSTPTLLKTLLQYGKLSRFNHQSLRYVFFAGEVFPIPPLKALKHAWPQAQFFNFYGPTETNVVTWFKIPDQIGDRELPFPIGKACDFAQLKIVGEKNPKEGALWVSGDTVTPGYFAQPEKNKTAFAVDENGVRWYKTGDWVRKEADGNLTFLGRKDRMVKRRGYRIELAEIEAALNQHPDVLAVAVVAHQSQLGSEIIAFYQMKNTIQKLENEWLDLQQFCLNLIPKYMLPDRFERLEEIPQTSTHKVDYQKLKAK